MRANLDEPLWRSYQGVSRVIDGIVNVGERLRTLVRKTPLRHFHPKGTWVESAAGFPEGFLSYNPVT